MAKEGSRITIHLDGFHIPYVTPPLPKKEDIDGWDLPKKEQKWKRPIFPTDKEVKEYTKQERTNLIEKDFRRRLFGYWFMNNGEPTYITGDYYFYLTHWFMGAMTDDGYPEYRMANRNWMYVVDLCERSPTCFGSIMMCQKRDGKTERHLSILYNRATLIDENSLFGLQSLTATEAKNNLFKGRLMRSHKRIQNYLKPVSNETNSSREIVSELTFMGENLGGGEYKDALNNVIDWRPTIASAYQGKKPREIFIDEPGSIEEMDLIEWWTTVREQLALGKKIYGKAFLPTTLEDMKKRGAESFKKIWYDSDPEETDENGRTKSGLWRYFKPFYSGREGFIDEYGNDLADEAKRFRQNTLDSARDADKRKIKRQYPETVEEAFDVIVGSIWEDDVKEILKDANELSETVFIRAVTLYEVDGVVKTRPANKGDDTAVNILEEPRKNTKISLGIDSASTDDETGSDGGSKIAAVATCGFGEMNAQFSPVMSLSERPMNKESVYHKIYLMAKYIIDAGAELEIVGEINGGGTDCFHYLCNKGLKKYMTGTPKEYSNVDSGDKNGKYWVYVNGDVLYFLHGLGNRFIRQNGSNFRLRSVIKSLLSYGLQNEDEASAFLISLINFRNFDKPVPKKKDPKPKKRTQFNPSTMMWEDVPI